MRLCTFRGGRAASIALVAWMALALPAAAEDALSPATAETAGHGNAGAASPKFEVTIPTIQAVGSNIDEPTLRAIFSGDLVSHADELATLSATSIRIPELRVSYATPAIDGKAQNGDLVFRDLRLNQVAGGVAQAVIVGSTELTDSSGGAAKFGKMSAEDFDIGGLLAFVGLVKSEPGAQLKTIYRNLLVAGGTVIGPDATCAIGASSVARFSARPPKMSFADFFDLAAKMDPNGPPPPETLAKFVDFYADLVEGMEVSPTKFDGFQCAGKDDAGKPIAVKVGPVTVDAFANGRYPGFVASDIAIAAIGDGEMGLGEFRFKGFDISGILATLKQAGGAIDDTWLQAHYRELLPTFEGFGLSGFTIDMPDEQDPGQRIKGSIADFDLTLKSYVNGIPTDIATSASHIVALLPTKTGDASLQRLLDLGIDRFDLGYDVALKWDEPSGEIRLGKFSVTGVDMGSLAVASVIGKATRDLFSSDLDAALAASMGLTLKRVKIDIRDAGLADIILQSEAKAAGKDVTEFRQAIAGFIQGTMLLFLGGVADADEIGKAVADFINGAKSLSVAVTAKDPAGVTFDELTALKDDPSGLADKVTIDAVAK